MPLRAPAKLTIAVLLPAALAAGTAVASTHQAATAATADPVVASGPGGTLVARPAALLGRTLTVRGTLDGARAGRRVVIQREDRDGTWETAATARVARGGAFTAYWRTDRSGHFALRAVLARHGQVTAHAASTPASTVVVYRPANATYYGPGFYGRKTACGQVLSHALYGVAHRSLPCGTMVDLYFAGRRISVPVVDRGPFNHAASYDLTSATAEALGMTGTARIGAIPVRAGDTPAAPAPPPAAPEGDTVSGGTAPGA